MVKLVGVVTDDKTADSCSSPSNERSVQCLARRQVPLVIEPQLTMIMELDDSCVACGQGGVTGHSGHRSQASAKSKKNRNPNWEVFLRNYRSLSKDEVCACLMVTSSEVTGVLGSLVTCPGCRRSVETLYQTLSQSADTALDPLIVASDGVVSVDREHILAETSLANLFCNQVDRLSSQLSEGAEGGKARGVRRQGRGGRCSLHSLEVRKVLTMNNWLDTWACMELECREEALLLPFQSIRHTLDQYLKKHSFCSECTNMVNKAYNLLVEEGLEPAKAAGEKTEEADPTVNSDGSPNLYCGISACMEDGHIHVKCEANFVGQLFRLAEPELSGLRQERHAKTIEIAQKEVLTCIGLALFERFQRIQQKLREAEQTCDLLFLTLLKTLRMSLDLAAEKKRGIGDLELLCEELEKEEKKKEGKRERKRNRRARKKETKIAVLAQMGTDDKICSICCDDDSINSVDSGVAILDRNKAQDTDKEEDYHCTTCTTNLINNSSNPAPCSKTAHSKAVLSLEEMLDNDDKENECDEDEENFIPEEDIKQFLESQDVLTKRKELRENLKFRFAQMCMKAAQVK